MDFHTAISILHLDENTITEKNIKQSYLQLAKQFHPDKNKSAGAEEKFKQINEAYSFLQEYKDFNKLGTFLEKSSEQSYSINVLHEVYVTLSEVFTGTTKIIQYEREIIDPSVPNFKCELCAGTGKRHYIDKSGNTQLMFRYYTCNVCGGKCFTGNIKTTLHETTVLIPAGTLETENIIFKGKGHERLNGDIGDLLIRVVIVSEEDTTVDDNGHLHKTCRVPFETVLLGGLTTVKICSEKTLNIKIPECSFKKTLKLKNQGIPLKNGVVSDVYIKLIYSFPKKLTEEQRKTLRQVFKSDQSSE